METEHERALIDRVLGGDVSAYGELVQPYRDVVFRVAARVVGTHSAEDVSQDALLRAFHRLSGYRGEGSFRAWLLQVTHNAALTALDARERRREDPVDPEQAREAAGATRHLQQLPADSLEQAERRERLEGKLGALRPAYRSLIVLRDVEGLSYEEIAQAMEMPIGSVKGRLHRARAEMIDLLRANTYDWELPE